MTMLAPLVFPGDFYLILLNNFTFQLENFTVYLTFWLTVYI